MQVPLGRVPAYRYLEVPPLPTARPDAYLEPPPTADPGRLPPPAKAREGVEGRTEPPMQAEPGRMSLPEEEEEGFSGWACSVTWSMGSSSHPGRPAMASRITSRTCEGNSVSVEYGLYRARGISHCNKALQFQATPNGGARLPRQPPPSSPHLRVRCVVGHGVVTQHVMAAFREGGNLGQL